MNGKQLIRLLWTIVVLLTMLLVARLTFEAGYGPKVVRDLWYGR